jgi:hypothetical protein
MAGYCDGELRLPLTSMSEAHQKELRSALTGLGLLK